MLDWRVTLALLLAVGCARHGSEPSDDRSAQRGGGDEGAPPPGEATEPLDSPEPAPDRILTPVNFKIYSGAVGDLDGDGVADVLALVYSEGHTKLALLRGAPDGRFFADEPQQVLASGLALGDLDGDGDLDALLLDAKGPPHFRVVENDGRGGMSLGARQPLGGRFGGELRGAALADLDDDGDLDVLVPMWDALRVLDNDGRGQLSQGRRLASGRDPFEVAIADLDLDGHLDLLAVCGAGPSEAREYYERVQAGLWIWPGRETGFAEPERQAVAGARRLAVADLDGAPGLEVAVAGSAGVSVVRAPLGARELELIRVATDGPLASAELLSPPGAELLTTSYMQGQLHLLTAGADQPLRSLAAGDFSVGLFAAELGDQPVIVSLNAGSPGGAYGPPGSSVELLLPAAFRPTGDG